MNAFGKCEGGGRRSAPRAAAPLIATLTTITHAYAAVLEDISCTGARLRGVHLPAEGQDVVLKIDCVEVFASTVWSTSDECGLEFECPLGRLQIEELRREAGATRRGGLSPEQRAALDEWELGIAR